jgi:hypothetical protein
MGENRTAFSLEIVSVMEAPAVEPEPAEPAGASETSRVEAWREEELIRAGYDAEAARLVALRADIDLHQAIEIVRGGCEVELALEILL